MTERNLGRPWTSREDHLLTQAVALYGENDNWKTIALSVPDRTNKACRKRWLHSLSPSIKKTAWTLDEDRRLLDLFAIHGPKWSVIARQIPGRTDDACSKRYREALDPSLKKDEWSAAEDQKLTEVFCRIGGKWGQVGQELNRSGLACRNRWRMLERKRAIPPPREPPNKLSPVFQSGLAEFPPEIHPNHAASWPASFMSMGWPYDDNPMLPRYPPSPDLSSDFSPASTLLELSPVSHVIPLAEPPAFPPFRFSSSSLSAALSVSPTLQPSPLSQPSTTIPPDDPGPSEDCHSIRSNPGSDALHKADSRAIAATDVRISHGNRDTLPTSHHNTFNVNFNTGGESVPRTLSPNSHDDRGEHSASTRKDRVAMLRSGPSATNDGGGGDVSSASSTPVGFDTLTLSPISSPASASLSVDLPKSTQSPSTSTLFLPSGEDKQPRRKTPKRSESQGPLRLSSNLLLTPDRSVLPYTCGYDECHTPAKGASAACFATSKELSEHCRAEHATRACGDRPYRCGLEGCGKSWKSVNGLQYHLQISRSHFQQAISSTLTRKSTEVVGEQPPAPASEGSRKPKRFYSCSQPQCSKIYRQLSGLRYHHLHGHPRDMPAQLQVVPPTLARKVADKLWAKDTQTGG